MVLQNLIYSLLSLPHFYLTVPLPCIVTDWTEWSAPDATGTSFRWRMVTRPSLNGGKECPDLIQSRKSKF